MRRLITFSVLCCLAVGLVAAAPHTPGPRPTPSPTPFVHLNLPSFESTVLIYPFDTAGELSPKVGVQIAHIFADEFKTLGNFNVLPVPTNIERANFLVNAHTEKADYYIAGYVTPIGQSVAVVTQLVGVESGVILYSQTQEIYGVNDAASLALQCHDALLEISGTKVSVTTTEAPTGAPSAAPTKNGANFNVSHLFAHHAAATARPVAVASVRPERAVILVGIHGQTSLPSSVLNRATTLLTRDLAAHFTVRDGGEAPANLASAADAICGTDRDNTIASGTLTQQHVGGFRPHLYSRFTLQIWTCFGDVLYETTESNDDVAKAILNAVSDYVQTHPSNS